MKKIKLINGRVLLSPVALATYLAAVYAVGLNRASQYFLALFLHECAHIMMGSAVGANISQLEITPFGVSAQIDSLNTRGLQARFLTALAGPAANLVAMAALICICSDYTSNGFFTANAGLFAINLLPAVKTDGGRMLFCVLERFFRRRTAQTVIIIFSFVCAAAGVFCGIILLINGFFNLSIFLISLFFILSASEEIKMKYYSAAKNTLLKTRRIKTGMNVSAHAVSENATVLDAIKSMEENKYNIFYVVSPDMRAKTCIDEGGVIKKALCEGVKERLLK